ncbi:MAG: cobalamin B12-binding domain-containing protein [Deltaproteobacteria bacterium]|nr:cobalamin B12-binding domain-containing protein [Deltaproteobacteria bacterium]
MRILLVKPKPRLETIRKLRAIIFLEPLELGYVAAAVPTGHDVRVLDLRLSRRPARDFVRVLERERPEVVGLSGYTHESATVKALAAAVRRILPRTRVVVGGHHATVLPADFDEECFDAIVRGEGCAPFRAIIEAIARGDGLDGIENVLLPGPGFDAAAAARMPVYPDLSTLPVPRRDLWDPSPYQCIWPTEEHPPWKTIFPQVALVRTSFGCRMDCSFCMVPSLSGRRHLTRPPEDIADELASLAQDHVYFCDDETFLNEAHARQVAEAIAARGIRKRYFAWARSTTVNRRPELFRLWREIGLDAVFLGFEAISDADLDRISKHSTVADNERAHAALREMGISVQAGFMVNAGFTRRDFRNLRDYMRRMPPAQITCTVYTPSPGSPAWHEERSRYVCPPFALHDCMHPLTETAIPRREFCREFAALSAAGASRNPLRANNARFPVRDIVRIVWAARGYAGALRRVWRDY